MGRMKALIFAAAIVLGGASNALAADLLPYAPPAPPPVEPLAPVAVSGWYLRGDLGVGINQVYDQSSTFQFSTPGGFTENGSGVGPSAILGGGVGYQFNEWFRADITGEYRTPSNYWGLESYAGTVGGGPPFSPNCPATCYDRYSANVSSAVFLANGYVDLGTWWGVTPYVGAGIGGAYNMFNGLYDTGLETGGYGSAPDSGTLSLAWAVMAGVSYAITPNLRLEFGYRYINLGNVNSYGIECANGGCGSNGEESLHFNMASNDVRLGLRYIFTEAPPVAPPLVTKY